MHNATREITSSRYREPVRAGRALCPILSLVWVLGSLPAAAAPTRVVPQKKTLKQRRAARNDRDLSEGGSRRGVIELTLGTLTAGLSVVLIGRGGWEIARAKEIEQRCDSGEGDLLECGLGKPGRDNRIAAGLSFGFSVPFAVASGFLFARGARIHRHYKTWKRNQTAASLTLAPWAGPTGGGIHLHVSF